MEKQFSPHSVKDWLNILKNKNITNPDLNKTVERLKRKPKPDTSGTTPGKGPSKNRRNETVDSTGKVKPHRSE